MVVFKKLESREEMRLTGGGCTKQVILSQKRYPLKVKCCAARDALANKILQSQEVKP